MTLRKKLVILFVIVLLAAIVQAQDSNLDYSNPQSYNNPDFYNNPNFNWEKIPPERIKDVPADKLKYEELTSEQRKEMTAQQISQNFDKIQDLTKDVSKTEAEKAIMQTYGAKVDLGNGARIQNGILQATYGVQGKTTLASDTYKNGRILVDESGYIIFYPEGKKDASIPENDFILIDTQDKEINLNVNGKSVPISGKIIHDAGRFYVREGTSARVHGLGISAMYKPIEIYFNIDNQNLRKDSTAFSDSGFQVNMESGFFLRAEKESNPYFKPGESFELEGQNVLVSLQSGDIISRITFTMRDETSYARWNGLHIAQNNVYYLMPPMKHFEYPLINVKVQKPDGTPIIGTQEKLREMLLGLQGVQAFDPKSIAFDKYLEGDFNYFQESAESSVPGISSSIERAKVIANRMSKMGTFSFNFGRLPPNVGDKSNWYTKGTGFYFTYKRSFE
ncbi:hypothetical protein HYY70_00990 [Candidatus Woesearchaeota archaeon]|nr:hypothetical protein [Candidatus Woesearchaeota archaeon]